MSTKKIKTIPGNEIKRGMVVRLLRYEWEFVDRTNRPSVVVAEQDGYDRSGNTYELLGQAKEVTLPGAEYPAFLFKRKLFVGCQTIDAVKAFKNLGKALGYEVTG